MAMWAQHDEHDDEELRQYTCCGKIGFYDKKNIGAIPDYNILIFYKCLVVS